MSETEKGIPLPLQGLREWFAAHGADTLEDIGEASIRIDCDLTAWLTYTILLRNSRGSLYFVEGEVAAVTRTAPLRYFPPTSDALAGKIQLRGEDRP